MRWLDFFFAARPLLHIPIWSIYLVCLRYHQRLSGESFAPTDLFMLGSLSLLTAGAYYINQVHDVQSDTINRKLGFIAGNYVSVRSAMVMYLVLSAVPLVAAVFVSLFPLFLFAQIVVLGNLYSAPPFRLKDRPLGGLLVNAYGIGFLIPLTVMPEINQHNAGLLGWDNPFYFFFAVGGIYLLTTIADREGDRLTGKRTLSVLWPAPVVKTLAGVLLLASVFVAFESGHMLLVYISVLSVGPVLLSLGMPRRSAEMFATKFPIVLLALAAGWFFPLYLVFLVVLIAGTRLYYHKRFGLIYPKLT